MSGIIGIVHGDDHPVERKLLEKITDYLSFRGPDSQNIWLNADSDQSSTNVGLGHALLRTTRESAQEQSPCSLDGKVWISADARIDSRSEIIEKLQAKGCSLNPDLPDVELILFAYKVWNEKCLDHLIGDFAFIIWDEVNQSLFCARDHFGIVPFFYSKLHHGLILSNSLNAIRLHPAISDEVNDMAIAEYLVLRSNWNMNTTTFAHILRLPPGHKLLWSASSNQTIIERYCPVFERGDYLNYKNPRDYAEHFREIFNSAVTDRLRSNHVSVAMSGGMDSTSVAAVAHKVLSKQGESFELAAFSAAYTMIKHEEEDYSKIVADSLGIDIHYLEMEQRLFQDPPDVPAGLSPEPGMIFSFWLNPWGSLWQQASSLSRVLLTGHGGDPLFRIAPSYWIDLIKKLHFSRIATDIWHYYRHYKSRPPLFISLYLKQKLKQYRNVRTLHPWIKPQFAERLNLQKHLKKIVKNPYQLDQLEFLTVNPYWSNFLASWEPNNTQLPFKVRFPFFDLRLINFLLRLPPLLFFQNKKLLRESMHDILPKKIINREKTLLSENLLQSFVKKHGVPKYMEDLAQSPELEPYVDREELLRAIKSPGEGLKAKYLLTIRPVSLAYWLENRNYFLTNR